MIFYYYKNTWGGGFTNQFVFLIDHLIAMERKHTKEFCIVFLDVFKNHYTDNENLSSFSEIIDISWLNNVVFKNIFIIDLYKIQTELRFGWIVNNDYIELNPEYLLHLVKYNKSIFEIEPITNDPSYRNKKPFWLSIPSKKIYYQQWEELCGRLMNITVSNMNGKGIDIMYDNDYKHIFRYMSFIPSIHLYNTPSFLNYQYRNVIHIRNEDDALTVWNENDDMITKKYIKKIKEIILPTNDTINIILTARKYNNPIIEWMKQNNYIIYIPFYYNLEKQRERMAILDLQMSTQFGNNIFIGFKKSSFSQLLSIRFTGISELL